MDHVTVCTLPASSVLLKVRTDSPRRLAALSFSFRTLTLRVLSNAFSFLTAFRSFRGESLLLTLSSAGLLKSREGPFSQFLVMGPRALVSLGTVSMISEVETYLTRLSRLRHQHALRLLLFHLLWFPCWLSLRRVWFWIRSHIATSCQDSICSGAMCGLPLLILQNHTMGFFPCQWSPEN